MCSLVLTSTSVVPITGGTSLYITTVFTGFPSSLTPSSIVRTALVLLHESSLIILLLFSTVVSFIQCARQEGAAPVSRISYQPSGTLPNDTEPFPSEVVISTVSNNVASSDAASPFPL